MKEPTLLTKIGDVLHAINPLAQKDPSGSSKNDKVEIQEQTHQGITWIDIVGATKKDLVPFAEKYSFDPLHVKASASKGQLDRLEVEDKYLFILLHAPKYNKRENRINTTRISFFLGKKFLVSVHKGNHEALTSLFAETLENEERRDELFKKSPAFLLYQIFDVLIKDMVSILETIQKEVDEIEDLVFDVTTSGAYEITQMRQKIVRLQRGITPLKNILHELAIDQSDLTLSTTRSFKYLTHQVNKMRELLDDAKEVIEIYKDADFTMSTDRTNKILGILTIIFTLAIPAQIVGSFYGMNVLIPGGIDDGPWMFLGKYTTFFFVIFAAFLPAVLMLWLFKRKKWF